MPGVSTDTYLGLKSQVLGPLTVSIGGINGTPSAPKLRQVLALLLVHANQVVPVPSISRELWDDEPPRSGLTTLQTYILHLRKLLASAAGLPTEEVAKHVLLTRNGGYTFRTGLGELDLHDFETHCAKGRSALN
ncbi:MAG: AfsR/SARP family transcriptional regulator, partial [Solirubrobacterales bacterium]